MRHWAFTLRTGPLRNDKRCETVKNKKWLMYLAMMEPGCGAGGVEASSSSPATDNTAELNGDASSDARPRNPNGTFASTSSSAASDTVPESDGRPDEQTSTSG